MRYKRQEHLDPDTPATIAEIQSLLNPRAWRPIPTEQDIVAAVGISEGRLWRAPRRPHEDPPIVRIHCAPKEHDAWGNPRQVHQGQRHGRWQTTTRSASRAATSAYPAPSGESSLPNRPIPPAYFQGKSTPGAKPKPATKPQEPVHHQKRKPHQRAASSGSPSPSPTKPRTRRRHRSPSSPSPSSAEAKPCALSVLRNKKDTEAFLQKIARLQEHEKDRRKPKHKKKTKPSSRDTPSPHKNARSDSDGDHRPQPKKPHRGRATL